VVNFHGSWYQNRPSTWGSIIGLAGLNKIWVLVAANGGSRHGNFNGEADDKP